MKSLAIDSRIGGLGDIWMRLMALYTLTRVAGLDRVELAVKGSLVHIARAAFFDRLEVVADPSPHAVVLTHLGLRHTLGEMARGRRFVYPFFRLNELDRKERTFKSRLNAVLIELVARTGAVRLPRGDRLMEYQGYMEMTALPAFAEIEPAAFATQGAVDLPVVRERMQRAIPLRPEVPLMVFPSGSAHQGIPVPWARQYLPNALFVFFDADDFKAEYDAAGLRTETFRSVEDLLSQAARAQRLLTSESFTSHILQSYRADAVIALTQGSGSRLLFPGFDGLAVPSEAPCCPCRSLARGIQPLCDMGHLFCVTWNHPRFIERLCHAIA